VRDSLQLSSSNGLGEEHNTEPKTNATAASDGKILFYQGQLLLEQQKCPNSALKCPSSASTAKKSNQWKQAKTGKQACPEFFNPYANQDTTFGITNWQFATAFIGGTSNMSDVCVLLKCPADCRG
jgi:hypothetical protein